MGKFLTAIFHSIPYEFRYEIRPLDHAMNTTLANDEAPSHKRCKLLTINASSETPLVGKQSKRQNFALPIVKIVEFSDNTLLFLRLLFFRLVRFVHAFNQSANMIS